MFKLVMSRIQKERKRGERRRAGSRRRGKKECSTHVYASNVS